MRFGHLLSGLPGWQSAYAIKRRLTSVRDMTLDRAPLGHRLVLQDAVGVGTTRRLAALGLRRGVEVTLLQRTCGGGRIAMVGGTRLALGPGVLKHIQVAVAS